MVKFANVTFPSRLGQQLSRLIRQSLRNQEFHSKLQDSYNKNYHKKNGFDRRESCKKRPSTKFPKENNNKVSKTIPRECCGKVMIQIFNTDSSLKLKGFDRTIFKPVYQECCNDGTVRDIGECQITLQKRDTYPQEVLQSRINNTHKIIFTTPFEMLDHSLDRHRPYQMHCSDVSHVNHHAEI